MKREKYIPIPLQQKIWQGSCYTVYRSRRKKRKFLKITRTQEPWIYVLKIKGQDPVPQSQCSFGYDGRGPYRKDRFYWGRRLFLCWCAGKNGKLFIIALLGCGWPPHKTWKWSDARSLLPMEWKIMRKQICMNAAKKQSHCL